MSIRKNIELAVRRQFNRWFRADRNPVVVHAPSYVFGVGGASENNPNDSNAMRILVLRQDRIGDVLISTPIVRALRNRFPNARIDALMSDNNIGTRRAFEPYVNEILHYRKSVAGIAALRSKMRANRYDVVVDMTDNASSTSSMLVTMSNARYAVGIDKENRGVYTHVVPRADRLHVHIIDRIVPLLWPFGIDPNDVDKRVSYGITPEELQAAQQQLDAKNAVSSGESVNPNTIRIGVNLSGSTESRRLEAHTTIAFITKVCAAHPQVQFYVFTTRDLVQLQRTICESTTAIAVEPSKSIHQYACTLACMHAIVTPDTAAVHLAAAWQMPSVVLYRPEEPPVHPWFPYNSYSVPLITTTPTVANITADEISAGIERMLNETGLLSDQRDHSITGLH